MSDHYTYFSNPTHTIKRFTNSIRAFYKLFLGLLLLLACATSSYASAPAGYSEYFIPGDENLLADIWNSLRGRSATATRHSVITVVAWSNNTTVYYDHWENGYNFDPNNPSTADETVVLVNKGDSHTFESASIPVNPQVTSPLQYDGRDRIYVAGGTVSVTRESWEEALGNVFTIAWDVYPVKPQMTTYILPFGEDLGYRSFVRVYALLQATVDNTVVQIDFDQNGTYDTFCTDKTRATCNPGTSVTLNKGEVFLLDNTAVSPQAAPYNVVHTGTLIKASSTLQVNYIAGHDTDNYQARGFSAFPRGFWDTEYYSPVDSSNGTGTGVYPANTNFPTNIYIYNPNATTLTINYQTSTGSGTFTVPANSTRSFYSQTGNYVPQGSGVYLKGDDVFWGVTIIDDGGPTHEWGHTLIPAFLMGNEQYIGWAPSGTTPSAANANDAGIFITPAQDNTVVFVDRDNDGTVDYTYTLNRMQTQYVYDATDGDMSNSHIWATGPITLAYGQNTASSPTGAPAIDVGFGILPGGDWIDKVLTVSKTANPVVVPTAIGSQSIFTMAVNSYYYAVNGISVVDTLPTGWQFVNNSATITLADMTTISGAAANPTISGGGLILTWTSSLLSSMAPNQQITITFTAQTTAVFAVGAITRNISEATGTRTVGGLTQTFVTSDFAFNTYGNMTVSKTSSATDPLYPGDQFTYTVTATNPTAAAFTGVSLYDPLPAGVSYVAGSGSLTCDRTANIRDEFASAAYNLNGPNNTANWAGAWTETDIHGIVAGATAGFVLVTGNALQFRYQTSTYIDNLDTAFYNLNNGTNNWSTNWTETGDDGTAGGGTITVDAGNNNRVNFGPGAAGRAITRTAAVSGGSVTISFTLSDQGIDAGEGVIAEYDLGLGAGFQEIQRITNNTLTGTNPLTVNTAGATSITMQFRTFDTVNGIWEAGDNAGVDAVNIAVNNAVGSQIQRTADLTGASSASLNFTYASANLDAGADILVVEASSSPAGPFTTLATFNAGVPNVAPPYNIAPYISATTTTRFRITGGFNATNETLSLDNVDITYSGSGAFASGNPPEFLNNAMGCTIQPGNSLTLTYNVTVDNPLATGIEQITNTASINSNEIILPLSASVTNLVVNPSSQSAAIISSYVWLDADADGVKDVGEPGLGNVEVTLKDQFGTPIATTVTDGTGRYAFAGITPGNGYYVEVTPGTLPAGLTQSAPTGHSDNRTNAFNLAAGQSYTAANLGYKPAAGTATFGDLVWSDADGNGIRDFGEPGLTGVVVQLWQDVNKNGAIDGGDTLVGSRTTAPGGGYLFTGVAADGTKDYIVFVDSTQAVLTGFSQVNGYGPEKNVPSNSVFTKFDFGFQNTTGTFTIKDRIWNDLNKDSQDDGESGIAGVTVDLLDASRNVIATAITDASGYFTFSGVIGAGADYTFLVTDTSSVLTNYYTITNDAKAGELAINNVSANLDFTVEPTEPHFGYGLNRSIGGTVFNDLNGINGREAGESGISGVTVQLYNDFNVNGLLDAGDTLGATLVSDSNGDYLFSGLPDGRYVVSIPSPPAGYTYTTESPDNDPAAGNQQPGIIAAGGTVLNLNFGYQAVTPRSIAGTIWEDTNADGVVDAGEKRFQDVTIQVLDGATIIETLSTDVNGNYIFSGLTTKTYTIRIIDSLGILAGYTDVYENDGVMDSQAVLDLTGGSFSNIRFGFSLPGVTLVTLSSFRAYEDNGRMRIEWSTSFQRNTAGFYLLRRDEETGTYTQINRHILPALLSSPQGGTYSIIDNGTSLKRSNTYVLVEIEGKGKKNAYGPFTVPAGGGSAIQNPDISDPATPKMLLKGKANRNAGRSLKPAAAKVQRFTDLEGTVVISYSGNADNNAVDSVSDQISGYAIKPREISAVKMTRLIATKEAVDKAKNLRKLKTGTMVKISVDREGLYYIDAEEIATLLGITLNNVKSLIKMGGLAMKSQGKSIAYIPAGENGGIFFYGQEMDSIYAKENIYWLSIDKGLRMKSVGGRGPSPVEYSSFTESVHAEKDTTFLNTDVQDLAADYWFWSYLFIAPDYTDLASDSFMIRTDGVADIAAMATLTVHLKGFTDTDANPDHHIRVRLNGSVIGEGWLEGTKAEPPVFIQFDQNLLNSGDNVIGVEAVLDPGVPYSAFYINSFDISYQRLHEAAGNALTFRSEATGPLTVYGFTDPSILVFDITDPERPLVELAITVRDEGGSFSASFVPPSAGIRYLVTTPAAALAEINAWADTPSELTSKLNAADYIIIVPDQLKGAVQPLADYRQGQGYQTMVVNLEDIMDEFNYGISSPRAIHDFLAYAYYNWKKAPRYVVLAGEGTYDYKDNMGFGDNLVPTMVVSTPTGLFSSDNYFADADGDHLPDMAIGRLPVLTAEELQDLVRKIISFENTTGNHIMMLADNPDRDGNYPSDSDDAARLVPTTVSVEKMYLPAHSAGDIRNALLYGIPSGTFLVNYMGHGNSYTLADEGLLSIPDISDMENAGRLFVLSAMSCAVGEFAFPGYDSLSEALVVKKDKGAVAVFAPSGLSLNALSKTLDEGFFSAVFGGSALTLGDSLHEAYRYYKSSGGADFTLDIYNLLGDPALRLKIR